MSIESALNAYEYDCWCSYNHEHVDENGNWVSDDEGNNVYFIGGIRI